MYMGTKGKYHYVHHSRISMMKAEYRVLKEELFIHDEFPLTADRSQWRSCRLMEIDTIGASFVLIPQENTDLPNNGPIIEGVTPAQPGILKF